MVAFAVLFFLLLVSILTAVAIMVALKAVDFFDLTGAFYRRMEGLESRIDEVIRAIEASGRKGRE